jgi:hypothetical protein
VLYSLSGILCMVFIFRLHENFFLVVALLLSATFSFLAALFFFRSHKLRAFITRRIKQHSSRRLEERSVIRH